MYTSAKDNQTSLLYSIQRGKQSYVMTQSLTLPPVIVDEQEVWQFYYPDSEPNYITSKSAIGEVSALERDADVGEIEGKIVLIPSADPGYDWIFSHKIKGFITMYGGANSHMAIRAGELSIPAVVGIGVKCFEKYKNAQTLEIDAATKLVRILK